MAAFPDRLPLGLRCWRLLRLIGHLLWVFCFLLVCPWMTRAQQQAIQQRWSRQLLVILNVRLETAITAWLPQSLLVANHISWLDIVLLNAVAPVVFVAKAEVRRWPVVGYLAAKTQTVFLRRGSRGHAQLVYAEMVARMRAGCTVAIFPEGTTTDGQRLLNFHAALLQAAVDTGAAVQVVALSYRNAEGQPTAVPAYVGHMTLLQSLMAVLSTPMLIARLQTDAPLMSVGRNRRELAQAARRQIALKLGLPLDEGLAAQL